MVHITCTLGDLRRAGDTRDRCGYEFGSSISHQPAKSRKIGPIYIDKHRVAGGDPIYGIGRRGSAVQPLGRTRHVLKERHWRHSTDFASRKCRWDSKLEAELLVDRLQHCRPARTLSTESPGVRATLCAQRRLRVALGTLARLHCVVLPISRSPGHCS